MKNGSRWTAALVLLALAGAAPAGEAWEWEGRYAMELRLGTVTRVPVAGTERSVTRTLLLVDVHRRGERWIQRQRVCAVEIESDRVRMSVPAAFAAAIPERTYTSVRQGPGDPRRYTADLGEEALGYDPALTGGALPEHGRAPGVVDADGDGAPGATIVGHFPLFGSVRLYVAQRSHLVLRGRQVAPGRFEGAVDVRVMEQRTLGSSNRLFRRTLPMEPDLEASGFTMARTDAEDCASVLRQADQLFAG